jgi:hypothetical protein
MSLQEMPRRIATNFDRFTQICAISHISTRRTEMKTTTLGALAAFTLLGASALAIADDDHRNHARRGQGQTAPNAQTPQTHQHSEQMGQRMAEMHARMNERHGNPQAGSGSPQGGRAAAGRGHDHNHGQGQGQGQGHGQHGHSH